jgi:hypothetical protein
VKRRRAPRVLLDTNVWAFLADNRSIDPLNVRARQAGIDLQIAPSVVYEMLRTPNDEVRKRLVEAVTRPCWKRLMPEAYGECAELVAEIRRLREEWLRIPPRTEAWRRAANDWSRDHGGFWDRARHKDAFQADLIRQVGDSDALEKARQQSRLLRDDLRTGGVHFENLRLEDLSGRFPGPVPGWDGRPFELWRASGATAFGLALLRDKASNPYDDWVEPFVVLDLIRGAPESWWRFWLREVDKHRMPRCWLRWAFETTQATRKMTDGTPCDAQLGTYLLACEHFVTADRVLVEVVEKVRPFAPASLGRTWLVAGGSRATGETLGVLDSIANGG